MKKFNDLPIGNKFGLTIGLVVALLLIIMAVYHTALTKVSNQFVSMLETEIQIDKLALEVNGQMLQCRRNEKDFLLRKDTKYLARLKGNCTILISEAEEIISLAKEAGLNAIAADAAEIIKEAKAYQLIFTEVVNDWQLMGLDHNSGLQGKFRQAAHDLATDLQDHQIDKLYTDYLLLRRWEKDFLRSSGSGKYKKRLTAILTTFETDLAASSCEEEAKQIQLTALANYKKAFNLLARNMDEEKIRNAAYNDMRALAHDIEGAIKSVHIPHAEAAILEIRKHEKDFLLRHDPKYVGKLKKAAAQLLAYTKNSEVGQEHVTAVEQVLAIYLHHFEEMVSAYETNKKNSAKMREAIHNIEPKIDDIIGLITKIEHTKTTSTVKLSSSRRAISLILGFSTVLIAIVLSFFLVRLITRPLPMMQQFISQVAAGDLSKSITVSSRDEIGIMGLALNDMVAKLSALISHIKKDSGSIASSAQEMTDVSANMSTKSEESVSQANSVAAASEEMSANMDTVAAAMEETSVNISGISSATSQLTNTIGELAQSAEEATEVSQITVEKADTVTKRVDDLGRDTEEIGQVTDTIAAISEKTNLLALNATIEAARAGDAGKGFAVVANEIKELANQTADATNNIGGKLKAIQQATQNTVTDIEDISDSIKQTNQVVENISQAMEQQKTATIEISENISQISTGVQEVNVNITQTSQASTQVADEIAKVHTNVDLINDESNKVDQCATTLTKISTDFQGKMAEFVLDD